MILADKQFLKGKRVSVQVLLAFGWLLIISLTACADNSPAVTITSTASSSITPALNNTTTPPNNNSVTSVTNSPQIQYANKPDLDYPGAVRLKYNEKDYCPRCSNLQLANTAVGAFATSEDISKVTDFYRQKLKASGYDVSIQNMTDCTSDACNAPETISTDINNGFQIRIQVWPPKAWQSTQDESLITLHNQLKADQTLITYEVSSNVVAPTIPSKIASIDQDLRYPDATKLSTGGSPVPPNMLTTALATNDDFQKVAAYYKQNLTNLGYKISEAQPPSRCNSPACKEVMAFVITKSAEQAHLTIWSSKAWQENNISVSDTGSKPGSNQTLITYQITTIP